MDGRKLCDISMEQHHEREKGTTEGRCRCGRHPDHADQNLRREIRDIAKIEGLRIRGGYTPRSRPRAGGTTFKCLVVRRDHSNTDHDIADDVSGRDLVSFVAVRQR